MKEFDSVRMGRRSFLALASISLVGCKVQSTRREPAASNSAPDAVCQYRLYRAQDNFSCLLTTRGFYVQRRGKQNWLTAHRDSKILLLSFEFPPQHNAEIAIDRTDLKGPPNEQFDSRARRAAALMKKVGYLASKPAVLVFRIPRTSAALPRSGRGMKLALEHLLRWEQFEYVTEDANDPYRNDAPVGGTPEPDASRRRYLLGLEYWKGTGAAQVSAIDLPTGFYLQPQAGSAYRWRTSSATHRVDNYFEAWSAFLVGDTNSSKPLPSVSLELIDIHGVSGGQPAPGRLRYDADPQQAKLYDPTPVDFYDRMEMAVTLSPRFGRTDPPHSFLYVETDGSGAVARTDDCGGSLTSLFSQCHVGLDHTITATTYGISAEGGYLDFEGAWSVLPGCTVKGWMQKTHRGRDTFVKVTRKGWHYLHGFELELIEETERTYLRDEKHHLVAPNVKQVYIRVVQPAFVMAASTEEGFVRIDLVSLRTPPLDPYIDTQGGAIELKKLDAFIPYVDGRPFLWEFSGTDHAGKKTTWTQAGFFISNRQLSADPAEFGRFPEDVTTPVPVNDFGNELQFLRVTQACVSPSSTDDGGPAVSNFIKLVDRCWSQLPYRFGGLHGSSVAIAPADKPGDTTIELKWIEWTRGVRPAPPPQTAVEERKTVVRPLRSRARTLRFALPTMRQFSGTVPDMLGTFRDLRLPCDQPSTWSLDPEETLAQEVFEYGLLRPGDEGNASGSYLCVLPTDGASVDDLTRVYFERFPATGHAALFEGLSSQVAFGRAKSTEGLGGLSTPDCPVALLTRAFGPVGDRQQTFPAISACLPVGSSLVRGALPRIARPTRTRTAGGMSLGVDQLFGDEAEIIPGVKFTQVLEFVFSSGEGASRPATAQGPARSNTLEWQTRIVGLEWVTTLVDALGSAKLAPFLHALASQPPADEPTEPVAIGIESSLDWSTEDFKTFDIGLFEFMPHLPGEPKTTFAINAMARLDALNPDPQLSASCRLSAFALEFFKAINVRFEYVAFELDSKGNKRFDPAIGEVTFSNSLAFLQGLKELLQSLGDKYGIKISISPQRAMVSQVLAFPLDGSGVVYLGPAAITNLSFQWGVIIPILGRDSTRIFVSLASRESPMSISVGIYGGRAYALAEADTRGPRLVEISADYGGVFPANFGVARGSVSLTAGFTFTWLIQPAKSIKLYAFAQFSGNLSIASIFSICAHIMVAMGYEGGGEGGDVIVGVAECSCSFKLGFAEYSYSYTAHHSEKAGGKRVKARSLFQSIDTAAAADSVAPAGQPIEGVFYPFDVDEDGVDPRPAWAAHFSASA